MKRFGLRFRGTAPGRMLAFAVVAFASLLSGCGDDGILARLLLKPGHIIVETRPDAAYEKLFPYYVELCAGSQFHSKLTGEGGVAGHAVMYIKGACKEDDAPYPQLRRCRVAATSLDDPEHGAGISVNRWFKSVNWVAIPGYRLFFDGNLAPGERLTRRQFDAVEEAAIDQGIYKGVTFHRYPGAQSDTDLREFLKRDGIGTDFAMQFARSMFCARLPVTAQMLDQIIAFLNDKNREYAEGEADYHWSVWADNCMHTLRNALAAANIWSPLSVRTIKIMQIFNLAIPANEFVNLARLMTAADRHLPGNHGGWADARRISRISLAADRARGIGEDAAGARAQRSLRHDISAVHIAIAVPDGQDAARGRYPVQPTLCRSRRQSALLRQDL